MEIKLKMSSLKLPIFENDVVDLLLCPLAQDRFKGWKLQMLVFEVIDKIHIDQLNDTIQVLHECLRELERAKAYKLQNVMKFLLPFICICVVFP